MARVREFVFLAISLLLWELGNVDSYSLTSCVDPESPSSITSWKSTIPNKVGVVNGSKVFAFEGPVGASGVDFELKFGERIRTLQNTRVYVYVLYLNESPRRLVLQPVKNEKGSDFSLLPGVTSPDAGSEWGEAVEEIHTGDNREPSITGILKKPQRISVRKLVLFSLRSNSGESVAGVLTDLKTKSCTALINERQNPAPAPPQPASQQQPPTPRPKPTTITTPCPPPVVSKTPTSTDTCSVCPECKCVCNCNCKDAC